MASFVIKLDELQTHHQTGNGKPWLSLEWRLLSSVFHSHDWWLCLCTVYLNCRPGCGLWFVVSAYAHGHITSENMLPISLLIKELSTHVTIYSFFNVELQLLLSKFCLPWILQVITTLLYMKAFL